MTVVAAYLYSNGQRVRDITISEKIHCNPDTADFVWIGLFEPTKDEMQALQETYDLHPLAVEHALEPRHLPKVDVYGEQLLVTTRTAFLDQDRIAYGSTAIFVGRHHIISVRHGSARAHDTLRRELEAFPARLIHGTDYVLHAILDFIVDGYFPIVEKIEEEVLAMEKHTIDDFLGRDEITRIFALRRDLMRFQRILVPMGELANKLVTITLPCIDQESKPYFCDVRDHVHRVQVMVDGLRDVLSSVFEFSNLLEQQRTGVITRQLAAWAAILAVPTAIAGIYGMNFEYMPELKITGAYFIVLGLMLLICLVLYFGFKRSKWL